VRFDSEAQDAIDECVVMLDIAAACPTPTPGLVAAAEAVLEALKRYIKTCEIQLKLRETE